MRVRLRFIVFLVICASPVLAQVPCGALARSGGGLTNAAAARDQFRADIGGGTAAGQNGSFGGLRREITWDDVPDNLAAPNAFPGDFYNVTSARGVVLTTPGTGLQVSASAASGTPVRFGNLDPSYPSTFVAFSPERLFTPLGQPATDVHFFVPGTQRPAAVRSFGAMLTDVDGGAMLQLFGPAGEDYGQVMVPSADRDVTFVGITLQGPCTVGIGRVRITSTLAPGPGQVDSVAPFPAPGPNSADVVAIDDLIYSEPFEVPSVPFFSTTALLLLAIGLAVAAAIALR